MRKKASDGEKHSQAVSVLKAVRQMVQFHRGNFFDWCRKEALRQKLWWGGGVVRVAGEGGEELL